MQHKIENKHLVPYLPHPSGATSYPMRPRMEEVLAMLYSLEETLGHYHCEDCWYTCPMHSEGCCDEDKPKKCNCIYEKQTLLVEAIRWCLRDIDDKPNGPLFGWF